MQLQPDVVRFGSGGDTSVQPAIIAVVAVAIILMWLVPRKKIFTLFVLTAFLIPLSQRIVLAGVHLMMLRILLICVWARMLPEVFRDKPANSPITTRMDRSVLIWGLCGTLTFTLLYLDTEALINRIGYLLLTMVGTYFLLRVLIRDKDDVLNASKSLAYVAVAIAAIMLFERVSGHGAWFSLLEREGKARAQGPFLHSILAGTFGATLLPLFVLQWRKVGGSKLIGLVGVLSSCAIVYTSSSSTSVIAVAAGILALCAWPLRHRMRLIRWGTVFVLLGLHMVMKAPVWALISRIDLTGGSSSYHRYMLVDQFINRFFDWWILGVKSTNSWGWDLWDTSNQYVEMGITGGLITLIAFIAIIASSFRAVGIYRKAAEANEDDQWEIWCIGSALFAHAVGFFGITYFDQTIVSWMVVLAMIAAYGNQLVEAGAQTGKAFNKRGGFVRPPVRGLAVENQFVLKGEDRVSAPVSHRGRSKFA